MSEVKHTPGPWSACRNGECLCRMIMSADYPVATFEAGEWGDKWTELAHTDERGPRLAERFSAYGEISEGTARAIARLIAAAPDLLAALQAVADLKGWNETQPVSATGVQVLAAIAKATIRRDEVQP